jgi:hypothetical protein
MLKELKMSDIIFKTDGKETSRMPSRTIQELTIGTKCPETKLKVTRMTDIEKVKGEIKVLEKKLALLEEMENHKSPIEKAYHNAYGKYPITDVSMSDWDAVSWSSFQKGWEAAQNNSEDISRVLIEGDDAYIMGVKYQRVPDYIDDPEYCSGIEWDEKDNPKPMNEVMDRLENKYKQEEENAASYITDDVVDRMLKEWEENPPEFLKFELGKTLEALITRWWCDVFGGINQDWDMETAIDDLVDRIQLWLPREQSHEGTQSVSVIDLVDGYNDALTKIKSKLRNKK